MTSAPRLRTALLLSFVASLWTALPVHAQAPATAGLDEARRLTWRRDSRPEGVAALRRLAASPGGTDVQYELGRVLTWDAATRAEGVALLRRVTADAPGWGDADEALAEVLSWDAATRPEAVTRFRRLIEREPARMSARVKLAEVLSWNGTTREEAEGLYRAILQDDPSRTDATVGLARLLAWGGRVSESQTLYRLALAQEPADPTARIGLAQVDTWSGHSRASLATLAAYPKGAIDTPEAAHLRAQAYTSIGRPARALREYEAVLAGDPTNPAALPASRSLRRALRPTLEFAADGGTESGDADSKVRTSMVPITFRFHPAGSDTEISLSGSVSQYRNAAGLSRDTAVGAGVDTPIGNRVRLEGSVAVHEFDRAPRVVTGRARARMAPHDRLEFQIGAAREQLYASRLSLGGESYAGVSYGPSIVDEVLVGATARPARGWDAWIQATAGRIRGANIVPNTRREAFGGVGRSFRAGGATLRPGYAVSWMAYDRDLEGYPSTDLGGDGLTRRGVGGYFSPRRFLNQMVRLDATVPLGGGVQLAAGGGAGRQQVEDVWSLGRASTATSSDAYASLRIPAGSRVWIRAQVNYQDVAAAYERTVARITLGYGF